MTISCPIQSSLNTKAIQDGIEWEEELWLEKRAEEIKAAILSEDGYKLNGATYDISDLMEEIANSEILTRNFERLLRSYVTGDKTPLSAFFNGVAIGYAAKLAGDELAAMNNDEGF